ncbi:MAG: hypothetical protein K2Z81_03475 [Cyanobacteria bacterium]|nr:hypothetical protein [Cyanobacteriota bacterium]
MKNLKFARLLLVPFMVMTMTSCGGGDGDFEKMTCPGGTTTFEMPKPVKMQMDEKEGALLYVSQKGKQSFRVVIVKRNFKEDQAKGMTDEQVLQAFSQKILQQCQQQFKQMGFQVQFRCDGQFPVENAKGVQFQTMVGKAFVVERFYVNQMGIYCVEATTQDVQSPDTNRFLSSFKP